MFEGENHNFYIPGGSYYSVFITVESDLCLRSVLSSFGDLVPQDGGSLPDNPPTEVAKHRRLLSKVAGGRPRAYKVKTSKRFSSSPPVCHRIKPGSSCIFGGLFLLILVAVKMSMSVVFENVQYKNTLKITYFLNKVINRQYERNHYRENKHLQIFPSDTLPRSASHS